MSIVSPISAPKGSAVKKSSAKTSGCVAMAWDGITLPSPQKRERMEHIDKALQKVRRHDKGDMELPSAVRFAQELRIKSPKTIQRLIEEMRATYGLPIDYCYRRKGYFYEEDVAFLPFLQLSESELVAVYLTQHLGMFENTRFKASLKSAFRKLVGLFGGKLSFDSALLDDCFSFDAEGPHARFHPAHLDACVRAMLRREELELIYTKQHGDGAGVPEKRRVRPLHITYRDFAYYVLCQDLDRPKPRLFMVTRMNAVKETGVTFKRPKRFNARKYLDKAFKVFASQEGVRVVLQFAPSAAKRVTERRWHSTEKFTTLSNGGVEMTIEVGLAPDLFSWIGGFFGEVRVLEPGELKEKMVGLFEEALAAQKRT
jgi:predicted DNA-binding transcriptional regulator YafY